jgi:1-deoxy-D-xylulose-5-phosphate reductoisomerase
MSNPDMRVPIAHALSDTNRVPIEFNNLNFRSLELSFQEFPSDRMRIQHIAREVCKEGGFLGTIFNAANEIAVKSFLSRKISFEKIYDVIYRTFDNKIMSKDLTIESINEVDMETRIEAKKVVKSLS